MWSYLVLGSTFWIVSDSYAALTPFHSASVIAHDSSELVPVGAPAHGLSNINWSPGTSTLTERLTNGAQSEERLKIIHDQLEHLHDHLLEDFDREISTQHIPVEEVRSGELIFRPPRKLITEDSLRNQIASSETGRESMIAPSINQMKRYDESELIHIEKKAKKLKQGFDYTYMGDGIFFRNEKTKWDVSGFGGRIRVFDKDDHQLLYETGCCYCHGQYRSPSDLTLGESLLDTGITLCALGACGLGLMTLKVASSL
ncbi:secreted protein [Melampsora americana]|nr:secreted protein [Melampsora americana]